MVLIQREAGDSLFSKGMAHFDTHQVGCVEGRAIRRRGGEGTRANTTTQHFTAAIHNTQHSLSCEAASASLVLDDHGVVTRF